MIPIRLVLPLLALALPAAQEQDGAGAEQPAWIRSSWLMRLDLEPPVVLEGANVIDVESGAVREAVQIVVRAGRIESIGSDPGPEDARRIDVRGRFVIPGLFDLHAHVIPAAYGYDVPPQEQTLVTLLDHGVTTIRLLPRTTESGVGLAGRVASGELIGPRIVPASGVYEKVPQRSERGFGTPDEAFLWVQRDALLGARWIKIYNSMDEESLTAIVEAARSLGLKVCGHTEGVPPARAAEIGIACIEHVISFPLSCAAEPVVRGASDLGTLTVRRWQSVDDVRMGELLALLRKHGTAWVPTLVVSERMRTHGEHDGRPTAGAAIEGEFEAALRRAAHAVLAQHRSGGLVGLGTDFPVDGVEPGSSAHDELELLVRYGEATPLEALQIGTLASARILGVDSILGTVAPGMLADLVVLSRDPLLDVGAIRSIELVLHDGRVHRPRSAPGSDPGGR